MSKKRSTKSPAKGSRTPKLSLNPSGFVAEARKPLMFLVGMFAGSKLASVINTNVTPAVQGVLGLDGDSKQVVAPVITAVAGLAVSQMSKNQDLKMAGYGVAAVGGAYLAKNMLNIEVLPLKGIDEAPRRAIPGFGNITEDDLPLLGGGNGSDPDLNIEGNDLVIEGFGEVVDETVID